jgi:hypothetical protein
MIEEQRNNGITFVATLIVQYSALFMARGLLAIVLPALALGIVTAFLALRSASILHRLRPKRALLGWASLVSAALFVVSLLMDEPRSPFLMQLSGMLMLDFAFLLLGQLCASFIAGTREA